MLIEKRPQLEYQAQARLHYGRSSNRFAGLNLAPIHLTLAHLTMMLKLLKTTLLPLRLLRKKGALRKRQLVSNGEAVCPKESLGYRSSVVAVFTSAGASSVSQVSWQVVSVEGKRSRGCFGDANRFYVDRVYHCRCFIFFQLNFGPFPLFGRVW